MSSITIKTYKDLKIEERKHPYTEPEWSAENMNRKRGDTTFKQCGWCEYATSGAARYNCLISSHCNLLKSYGIGKDVNWDTLCIVKMLGGIDLESVIKSKEHEINDLRNRIQRFKDEISVIENLHPKDILPLPNNRIVDYIVGEDVWVFTKDRWEHGIVMLGYRTHDGCVSYTLDNYPETKEKPWGCGVGVPCILRKWEYQYFRNNLEDFQTWLALSNKEYNGEKLPLQQYYDSFIEDLENTK